MPWVIATFSDPAIAGHVLNPALAQARIADVLSRYPTATSVATGAASEWPFDLGGALLGDDTWVKVALAPDRVIRIWRHNAESLLNHLEAAEAQNIRVQRQVRSRGTGTCAWAMRMSRSGAAVAQLSIPLRYMHSPVELISLDDAARTIDLLCAAILAIPADLDLRPQQP